MRTVFVGASDLAVATANLLIDKGHDVVIVELNRDVIDQLERDLDCSFVHGDGAKPHILREVMPEQTDVLFCLTGNDQVNIVTACIGRTLEFKKVVAAIRDAELKVVCQALGLEHTIVPNDTIGRYLADMAQGIDILELSTLVRGNARFFSFVVEKGQADSVSELDLPSAARVVCVYRDEQLVLVDADTRLQRGDEVVIVTTSDHLAELKKRWVPNHAEEG